MSIRRLWQSFKDAGRGVKFVFKNEQNFRIQLFVGVLVLILGWVFQLDRAEFVLIIILVLSVLVLELLNSAVERFTDVLKPRLSYQIQIVKDIMAAVVFFASLGAVIIGIIIFWPHIIVLFN